MSFFHSNRNARYRGVQTNGFSKSRRVQVDLTDAIAFPGLDGADVVVDTSTSSVENDDDNDVTVRPWYIAPETTPTSISEADTILPGWIVLTSADARKPTILKPVDEVESEDDEDTMPMTTSKKPPRVKPEPVVEWTCAELLNWLRLDIARHERDVSALENDPIDEYDEDDEDDYKYSLNTNNDITYDEDSGEEYDEEYYEYD